MSDIPPQDEASHDKVKGSEPASPTGETQPDLINSSWSLDRDDIEASLRYHLERRKGLKNFYPDGPTEQHVKTATSMVEKLKAKGFLQEMALQMTWLIYYDMALLLDDSISMGLAKNSDRRETLLQVVRTVTGLFAYSRSSSTEGLKFIKFFNNPKRSCRDVRLPKINGLFKNLEYDGLTRIGTSLKEKVLSEYKNKYAEKPLIVLIVTDGEVEGEDPGFLKRVILNRAQRLKKELDGDSGAQAISYQFASIGNEVGARHLLQQLDDDEKLGDYIDCMEHESLALLANKDESPRSISRKWRVAAKLFLGAISDFYDKFKLDPEESEEIIDDDLPPAVHNSKDSEVEEDWDEEGGEDDF